ncbi:MAG: hypothetical protein AAF432_08085 [Planctomycetota bacterium]
MASHASAQAVGMALKRLRFGVINCTWVVAASLMVHLLIWTLVSMTSLTEGEVIRTQVLNDAAQTLPTNISEPRTFDPLATNTAAVEELPVELQEEPPTPEYTALEIRSKWDRLFELMWSMSGGFGKLAMIVMIPLVLTGVLLCAGSATPGVDRTVSSFAWTVAVSVLVLPIGNALELPWGNGPFCSYEFLMETGQEFNTVTAALYLLLPLVCIVGAAVAAVRFNMGVEAGVPEADYWIDPELEAEASGIKATSLHGGRAAGALKSTITHEEAAAPIMPAAAPATPPRAKAPKPAKAPKKKNAEAPQPAAPPPPPSHRANEVPPGDRPKRLI